MTESQKANIELPTSNFQHRSKTKNLTGEAEGAENWQKDDGKKMKTDEFNHRDTETLREIEMREPVERGAVERQSVKV